MKLVKYTQVNKRNRDIIKRLEKTQTEIFPKDLKADREKRDKDEIARKKEQQKKQKDDEKAAIELKKKQQDEASYANLFKKENMKSNQEIDDDDDFM